MQLSCNKLYSSRHPTAMPPTYILALGSTLAVSLISFVGILALPISKERYRGRILVLVSLAVGALLGDALFHLIPEAFADPSLSQIAPLLIVIGIVAFFLIEKALCHVHPHDQSHGHHSHRALGKINILADGMHNFLDGVLIGAAYLVSPTAGIASTVAVALHEIPQEFGDYGILTMAGYSRRQAAWFNFLSACAAILGAGAVLALGPLVVQNAGWVGALTAGGFLYIALADLLPELHREERGRHALLHVAVVLLGLALMVSLTWLE